MMEIVIVTLALLVLGICLFMKCMTELSKRIDELEKKIDTIKCRIDDVEWWFSIVNKHILDTYGMLGEMKDENKNS